MKIVNENIVPDYDPRLIEAALGFLERQQTSISGAEARTHVKVCDLLVGILKGNVEVPYTKLGSDTEVKPAPTDPKAD